MSDANLVNLPEPYGIMVKFRQRGVWSKAYTYKSAVPYMPGDVVLVEHDKFFSVGKVSQYVKDYDFNPDLTYKRIKKRIDVE